MSMPIIKPSKIRRCEAITDIIESVALEQTGLSHILNAEGEKIQAALRLSRTNAELLHVNKSVQSTINSVTRLETILLEKLELFNDCLCNECPYIPCKRYDNSHEQYSSRDEYSVDEDVENESIFTGTEEEVNLLFLNDSEVSVVSKATLPAGVTFANNVLTIPVKLIGVKPIL